MGTERGNGLRAPARVSKWPKEDRPPRVTIHHNAPVTAACTGCLVELDDLDGPTHRYIGASAACWDVYTRALAGDPPIGPGRRTALLVDAYAAQHPGEDSPQATQSAAVHLVVLYAVAHHGFPLHDLVALRQEAVAYGRRNGGFRRLLPTPSRWDVTIHDVVAESDPEARSAVAASYPKAVLSAWLARHGTAITDWYEAIRGRN